MNIAQAKVLMIVAFKNFRDEEFVIPFNELKKEQAHITVASTSSGEAQGMFGHKVKVDLLTSEVRAQDYHAIIYVGGKGTPTVRSDESAIHILTEAMKDPQKILSAICWAPTILAKAGVLKNKKATVWLGQDDEYQKKTSEVLAQYGASYVDKDVVVDGHIITGNGAPAASDFVKAIILKIKEL